MVKKMTPGTKLVKPPIHDNLIVRELVSSFANSILGNKKVGVVVAPAGYGKSILLSQTADLLINKDAPYAWLSLDGKDNDPSRFIADLIAACQSLDSSIRWVGEKRFGADAKTIHDYVLADMAHRLEAIGRKHVIFLDEYHTIHNSDVHSILERLILYSPPETVFVIACRHELKIALQTLKLREQLHELTMRDLSFGLEEIEQYLNSCKQLGLDKQLIKALAERTEGWVAGLQLASMALAGSTDYLNFIDEFTGSDRDVTDYLSEVILDQQPEEIKKFLLWTSALERMNAELITHILELDRAQETLEEIEKHNLFLIPLDRNRTWYRYHHLFGDFLKTRFVTDYPGKDIEIYQRACQWCAKNTYRYEAINYAILAKDFDFAAQLISSFAKELVQEKGEYWTLLHWVNQLPDECLTRWPRIKLAYSWSLIFSRQLSEARIQLEDLENYCKEHVDDKNEEFVELLQGTQLNIALLSVACDDVENSRRLLDQWLKANPEADPQDNLTVNVLLAHSTLSTFEFGLGEKAANKAVMLGKQHGMHYMTAWAKAVAGMVAMQRGNFYRAQEHLTDGLKTNNICVSPFSYMGSLISVLLAEVNYEQNNIEEAEALLKERFEYINNETIVEVAASGYTILAKLRVLKGDYEGALEISRLGVESATAANLNRLATLMNAQEVRILLQSGLLEDARNLAIRKEFLHAGGAVFTADSRQVTQEISSQVQAEIALASGEYETASVILSGLILHAQEHGRQRYLVDLFLLRCKAHCLANDEDNAVSDLLSALEIAALGGRFRCFLEAGPEVAKLLQRSIRGKLCKNIDMGYWARLNEFMLDNELDNEPAIHLSTKRKQLREPLIKPLTKRESQLLELISTGNTNRGIAKKLFISEQTVKWHLHQIYGKLAVQNRTSAIARARTLGLI